MAQMNFLYFKNRNLPDVNLKQICFEFLIIPWGLIFIYIYENGDLLF
jgi:hypothetical protein